MKVIRKACIQVHVCKQAGSPGVDTLAHKTVVLERHLAPRTKAGGTGSLAKPRDLAPAAAARCSAAARGALASRRAACSRRAFAVGVCSVQRAAKGLGPSYS